MSAFSFARRAAPLREKKPATRGSGRPERSRVGLPPGGGPRRPKRSLVYGSGRRMAVADWIKLLTEPDPTCVGESVSLAQAARRRSSRNQKDLRPRKGSMRYLQPDRACWRRQRPPSRLNVETGFAARHFLFVSASPRLNIRRTRASALVRAGGATVSSATPPFERRAFPTRSSPTRVTVAKHREPFQHSPAAVEQRCLSRSKRLRPDGTVVAV